MITEQIRTSFQNQFKDEYGIDWLNSEGEPDIEYVEWLENKLNYTQKKTRPPN